MLAVYGQARVGGDPVPKDDRVSPLQGDGQAAPLVPQHLLLLLACVPGQGPGQPDRPASHDLLRVMPCLLQASPTPRIFLWCAWLAAAQWHNAGG